MGRRDVHTAVKGNDGQREDRFAKCSASKVVSGSPRLSPGLYFDLRPMTTATTMQKPIASSSVERRISQEVESAKPELTSSLPRPYRYEASTLRLWSF